MSATETPAATAAATAATRPALGAAIAEGRRQMEICNACRYCEGYCAVFPAMTLRRAFGDADMTHLANLCHDCRGCYYACQYAPPHAFAINVPRALAEIRVGSWQEHAWPGVLGRAFARNGVVLSLALALSLALLVALTRPAAGVAAPPGSFYALMSHGAMVALFGTVFVLALAAMTASVVRYWRATGGPRLDAASLLAALGDAARMRHLSGGHGEGCNYEDEDAFSSRRRWLHQATLYGFLLCFASTSAATVLHYVLGQPAPYGPLSLPKLLGVPGGVLLTIGAIGLLWLKRASDPALEGRQSRGMDSGFTALLALVAVSGLALYWLGATAWLRALLALHLGAVLALFATMPYSRMVHGLYRMAALVRAAHDKRTRKPLGE